MSRRIFREISVRLLLEQTNWLDKRAAETSRSVADLVREAIDIYAAQTDPESLLATAVKTQEEIIEDAQLPKLRRRVNPDDPSNPLG